MDARHDRRRQPAHDAHCADAQGTAELSAAGAHRRCGEQAGSAGRATDAAAGNFADNDVAVLPVGKRDLVDGNVAKLVHQHSPAFTRRALAKQVEDGGRLSDPQKPSNDVRWNHSNEYRMKGME